jgi:hypothetical protein
MLDLSKPFIAKIDAASQQVILQPERVDAFELLIAQIEPEIVPMEIWPMSTNWVCQQMWC